MKKNSDKKQTALFTAKQRRFVDEYLVDFNATRSAIEAGYSEKTATEMGYENLSKPHIQAEIQKRQAKIKKNLEITQERIWEELASIAFSETTDFTIEGSPIVVGAKHKTSSKLKAIELMGKRWGLWENQVNPETEDTEEVDKAVFGDEE